MSRHGSRVLLRRVLELWDGCKRCPLHRARFQQVRGRGNPEARLVLVGEGPGADENREGVAFVGRSGRILDRILTRAGLDPDLDVWIDNTVACRPPGNRDPYPDEAVACAPRLQGVVWSINPQAIVTLGSVPAHSLLGVRPVTRWRGYWVDYRYHWTATDTILEVPTLVTFHPAYTFHYGEAFDLMVKDIKDAARRVGLTDG